MPSGANAGRTPSLTPLFLVITAFVIGGLPFVYVLWDTINHLLAGDVASLRPVVVLGALVGFTVVLGALARVVGRWERPGNGKGEAPGRPRTDRRSNP